MSAPTIIDVNLGAGLTIGTTTITGGTDGRILRNSSGVVGEYTLTGSGTVVAMQTSPTLTGPVIINEAVGSSGLTITGATQTTSQPALNITQTWNAGAVTFTGAAINTTKTACADASRQLVIQDAGVDRICFSGGNSNYPWIGIAAGTELEFRAINRANTAMVNAAYFQAGTGLWTASEFRMGSINYSSGDLFIKRAAAATLQMGTDINGAAVAQTLRACNGITGTDKAGANFTIQSGTGTGAGAVSSLIFKTPAVLGTGTTAQTATTRLTLVEGSATFTTPTVKAASDTAIPAGGTAGTGYTFSSTANYGVFFGSGAPTLSAAKGSLYLRSDGSGTTDRAYINTDGSTTWTALTTVA